MIKNKKAFTMAKETLYLDTSVVSNYFDTRNPLIHRYTRNFWQQKIHQYQAYISELVVREILNASDPLRNWMLERIDGLPSYEISKSALDLAAAYISAGVFSEKQRNDAIHAAVASTNQVDYIVSWNFKHLVKVKTRRELPAVNHSKGYTKPIEIVAPSEL